MNLILGMLIKSFGSELLKAVWQILNGILGKLAERALVLAQDIVRELDVETLKGPEKRALAYERLKSRFAAEGKEVSSFILYYAIETAYAAMKAALETSPAPKPVLKP
jgi:hypothetical protein